MVAERKWIGGSYGKRNQIIIRSGMLERIFIYFILIFCCVKVKIWIF